MEKGIRIIALKVVTLTAVFGFLYPLLLVAKIYFFRQDIGFWEACFNYSILLAGYFSGLILVGDREGRVPAIRAALACALPVTAAVLLYLGTGTGRVLVEGFLSAVLFFIGFRAFYIPFTLMLSDKRVLAGAAGLFVCMILTFYFLDFKPAKNYIMVCAYLFLGSVLLVNNQRGIDEAFIKRHIDHASIPGNMRRYNTSLVAGLFLLVTVLVNIKTLVGNAAAFLRVALLKAIYFVYWLFLLISNLTKPKGTQPSSGQSQNMIPDLGEKTGNSIVSLILTIVTALFFMAMLYVAVKKLPSMFRSLGSKIRELAARISRYLRSLLDIYEGSPEETDDYQDEVQTLKAEKNMEARQGKRPVGLGRKSLRRITDPVRKIRHIYGILLYELNENNIHIVKSDTTGEVFNKSKVIQDIQTPFSNITKLYEESKYGEAAPDLKGLTDAENGFKRVDEVLRRRKK